MFFKNTIEPDLLVGPNHGIWKKFHLAGPKVGR